MTANLTFVSNFTDVFDNATEEILTPELCLERAIVRVEGSENEVLSGLWYVGVIMSIIASISSNMGVNIQKFSMMKEQEKANLDDNYRIKPYISQPMWFGGLLLVILGSLGDFAALGFAAQSLATPVGGFTMVANVVFAHFGLGEHIGIRDVVATVLVVFGVVLVAASADKTQKTYTLKCLVQLYKRDVFVAYAVILIIIILCTYVLTRYLAKLRKDKNPRYLKFRKLHPVCPAGLSGLIGAQSVLFAKCTAEIVKTTLAGDNQFLNFETYIIICCMFFTIFNQLHWLAVGLQMFDAVVIVPIFQCFFITGGVIGGGIFFDEFNYLKAWEAILFVIGVIVTVIGVLLLAQREHDHKIVAPEENVKENVTIGVLEKPEDDNKAVALDVALEENAKDQPSIAILSNT